MSKFDHTHYVPILRWKQAERGALCKLDESARERMTPLIELVPTKPGKKQLSEDQKLSKAVKEIFQNWGQDLFFVDLWHLDPELRAGNGKHLLQAFGEMTQSYQLFMVPVTGLDREPAYQAAVLTLVKQHRNGVCVRLLRKDIGSSRFRDRLRMLLEYLGLQPENVDLLVDYQVVTDSDMEYSMLYTIIPDISRWRTFTVAGGAFPKDLTQFKKNSQYELARLDWQLWRDQVVSTSSLSRRPAYSDYTIQHPTYEEREGFTNFSGSIRYTHKNYWVIMRGEGVRNPDGPGYLQFPANAQLLCDRDEFCGADFSYGDQYIEEMGSQLEETGNAMTWLQAGINHHLTLVVNQISNLF